MITVDTAHQFDWLTVPPEAWPKQHAQLEGTCGICHRSVLGTLVTNARGPWERFECAEKAYNLVHRGNKHVYSGTQREFNDFVKESVRPVTVDYDYDRSKHARYRWWVA